MLVIGNGLVFEKNGNNLDVGTVFGTGIGGITTLLDSFDVMRERGSRRVSALMVPMMMPSSTFLVL